MPYRGPGVYRHYKGGIYGAIGLAIREEDKDSPVIEVVYKPLSPNSMLANLKIAGYSVGYWTRRLGDFNQNVPGRSGGGGHPDEMIPRFEPVRISKPPLGLLVYMPTHNHRADQSCEGGCPYFDWNAHIEAHGNPYPTVGR